MIELFKQAVQRNEEMRKPLSSVPWTPDEPYPQPYYVFDGAKQDWEPVQAPPTTTTATSGEANSSSSNSPIITRLAVYSWNIDFMLPHAQARMEAALAHLESLVRAHFDAPPPATTGVIIFLQECVVSDLTTISTTPWVRERFAVTDRDAAHWGSGHYGTTTLVDRRLLPLASCFRVHYAQTRMERDALFVDVPVHSNIVRLCNTHLESLAAEPPLRPAQMRLVAAYLRGERSPDPDVPIPRAGLAAGDFNAVQGFDRTLHADNGLRDAYLELGGREDNDDAYTWGQQAATELRRRYGCSRMDKVFLRGAALRPRRFARFGRDVQLADPAQRRDLLALGFDRPWVTDHLGVVAEVEIVD
ncbi:Endonuclease/exonuclease/phosphatase [Biscogniauxia sp. FL1348]|nr:Endonuclease/exonuclease/phosphatase [Biscogniauxia sp. FL1348]